MDGNRTAARIIVNKKKISFQEENPSVREKNQEVENQIVDIPSGFPAKRKRKIIIIIKRITSARYIRSKIRFERE